MRIKHTPGPWRAVFSSSAGMSFTIESLKSESQFAIAYTINLHGHEDIANAHLIASAPELLDALIKMSEEAEKHLEFDCKIIEQAQAAVLKALVIIEPKE